MTLASVFSRIWPWHHEPEPPQLEPSYRKFRISGKKISDAINYTLQREGYASIPDVERELERRGHDLSQYKPTDLEGAVGGTLGRMGLSKRYDGGVTVYYPDKISSRNIQPDIPYKASPPSVLISSAPSVQKAEKTDTKGPNKHYDWRKWHRQIKQVRIDPEKSEEIRTGLVALAGYDPMPFYQRLMRWDENFGVVQKLFSEGYINVDNQFHSNTGKDTGGVRGREFIQQLSRNIRLLLRCYDIQASIFIHHSDAYMQLKDEDTKTKFREIMESLGWHDGS